MRLQRVTKELQSAPQRLDLYDDAAVALDRLGRDTEALAWMEKKKARLQVLDAKNPEIREHWYRTYANAGTFYAHRWIHDGANRKKLGEVKTARDLIAKAIAIKPGAHFGREKYQLKMMDWILKPPSDKDVMDGLPDILGLSKSDRTYEGTSGTALLKRLGYEDAERGLTGLITLGAAWQSIDIFNALRWVEAKKWNSSVVTLLNLRLEEIAKAGRTSLYPGAPDAKQMAATFSPHYANFSMGVGYGDTYLYDVYTRLRAEADSWHERRTAFMLERLKAGRHPDTDSAFWDGWDDGAPPSLEPPRTIQDIAANIFGLVLLGGIVATVVGLARRIRRRKYLHA
jgi:hypothetical protein